MAQTINEVRLLGNVGNAPEVRTAGGSKVATFSLATSRSWTDDAGQKQERTQWHRVVCWNRGNRKLADLVEQYVAKGSRVHVSGEIDYKEWTDRVSGEPRHSTEIAADDVIFLSGKREAAVPATSAPNGQRRAAR